MLDILSLFSYLASDASNSILNTMVFISNHLDNRMYYIWTSGIFSGFDFRALSIGNAHKEPLSILNHLYTLSLDEAYGIESQKTTKIGMGKMNFQTSALTFSTNAISASLFNLLWATSQSINKAHELCWNVVQIKANIWK